MQAAAPALRLTLQVVEVRELKDFEGAFAAAAARALALLASRPLSGALGRQVAWRGILSRGTIHFGARRSMVHGRLEVVMWMITPLTTLVAILLLTAALSGPAAPAAQPERSPHRRTMDRIGGHVVYRGAVA